MHFVNRLQMHGSHNIGIWKPRAGLGHAGTPRLLSPHRKRKQKSADARFSGLRTWQFTTKLALSPSYEPQRGKPCTAVLPFLDDILFHRRRHRLGPEKSLVAAQLVCLISTIKVSCRRQPPTAGLHPPSSAAAKISPRSPEPPAAATLSRGKTNNCGSSARWASTLACWVPLPASPYASFTGRSASQQKVLARRALLQTIVGRETTSLGRPSTAAPSNVGQEASVSSHVAADATMVRGHACFLPDAVCYQRTFPYCSHR